MRFFPIASPKASNRSQRFKATGRPPNASRARKPYKNGTFLILNRREALAKNAFGYDMKNLTISVGDCQVDHRVLAVAVRRVPMGPDQA
jgi:hypothetical protein